MRLLWLLLLLAVPLSAQTPDSVRTYQSTHTDSVKLYFTRVVRVDTAPTPLPSTSSVGVPIGPFHYSLSATGPYNASTLVVDASTLLSKLAGLRKVRGQVVLQISLSKTKDANGVSVATAKSELDRWVKADSSKQLAGYFADGTALAVYIGDDVTDKTLNGACAPCWAKYDSIGGLVKARWPKAHVTLRSKPTDMAGWPKWVNVDMAWGQYSHITRDGEPLAYAQRQWASAKAQGICTFLGLNVINGGDGSSGVAGSQTGRFEMTGAEVLKYGTIFLRFTPAIIWWEYRAPNHSRIVAAVAELRAIADTTPRTVCL